MAQWGGAPPPHLNQSIRRGDQSLRAATGDRAGGEVVRLVRLGSVHAHTESALARLRSGLAHGARDRGLRRFAARLRRFLNPPTRAVVAWHGRHRPRRVQIRILGEDPMRGSRYDRILASTALALILAAPFGGVARDLDVVAGEPATKLAAVPMATENAQTAMPAPAVAPAPASVPAAAPAHEPQAAPAGTADPAAGMEQTATPDPLASLAPADRAVAEKIRDLLATRSEKIFSNKKERAAAEAFYQNRNLKPLWLDEGVENPSAKSAIARLKHADADGLYPSEN